MAGKRNQAGRVYGLPGKRKGEPDGNEVYDDLVKKKMDIAAVAKKYGVSYRTASRWRIISERRGIVENIPDSETPDFNKYLTIKQERLLVISDIEVPDHDAVMLRFAIEVGQEYAIETAIIAGDFWAFDMFSPFRKRAPQRTNMKEDIKVGLKILDGISKQFKSIIMVPGNHDLRPTALSDGQITVEDFCQADAFKHITWTDYGYCFVESGGRKCLVCHQKNYSGIPLSMPRRIIAAHHCDVLCAHNHKLTWGMDHSGRYWFGEGGTCRDPVKTLYKAHQITTHPEWDSGFYIILNGWGFPLHKEMLKEGFHTEEFRKRRYARFRAGARCPR